jgi:hypothetical protein
VKQSFDAFTNGPGYDPISQTPFNCQSYNFMSYPGNSIGSEALNGGAQGAGKRREQASKISHA